MSAIPPLSPSTQPTFDTNRAHLEAGLTRWCEEKRYDPEYYCRLAAAEQIKDRYTSPYTSLYLGDYRLTELPSEIGLLTHLESLYLGKNRLTALPSWIGLLTQLKRLDLDHNQIREIPPEIGRLTQLTDLFLNENQIREIPSEILLVPAIKEGVLNALLRSLQDEKIAEIAKFTFLLGLEEPLPEEGYNLSSFKNDLLFDETTAVSEIFDFAFPQKIETIDWIEDGETTPLPVEEVIYRLQAD